MSAPVGTVDLGPDGMVAGGDFVLGSWKVALDYCDAAQATDPTAVPFPDVSTLLGSVRSAAGGFVNTTYPNEVVALASGVVAYATKAEVYVPALAKSLTALGADPSNATLLKQVDAILQALAADPPASATAASGAATAVAAFETSAAAAEASLRAVATAYAGTYGVALPGAAVLPAALEDPVEALAGAWQRLATQLAALKAQVDKCAHAGTPFDIDLEPDATVGRWKEASAAADTWRLNAYVR